MREGTRPCIVGLGNEYRRDDGVGIWVARQIATASWPGVTIHALDASDSVALLSAWEGSEHAYLVDAVHADTKPGTIIRLGVEHFASPDHPRFLSSHGVSLAEAIDLGRALGTLPRHLVVYGIVGRDFDRGQGLSTEVAAAGREVIRRLHRAINRLGGYLPSLPSPP